MVIGKTKSFIWKVKKINKQIEFIVWDKRKNRMCEVINISWYWKDVDGISELTIEEETGKFTKITRYGVKDFILLEYTNRTDAEQQKLYDGDIVLVDDGIAYIKWDNLSLTWILVNDVDEWSECLVEFDSDLLLKKIGNIYSTPEYLPEILDANK